jgi:type I restriction enzyme S subunit
MKGDVNWNEKQIGSYLKLLSGFPFSSANFSNEEGFPLIRIRDIVSSQVETYFQGLFIPAYIIKQGDILIGMDGDFNIAKWRNQDALLNQRVLKVDVKDSEELDLGFIYYWLQPYIKKVNEITAATTVKHLSTKDLFKAKDKVPDIFSQRKIGNILQTIDQSIEKTEELIEKYQQIKTGLMQDLFTRGIGSDGKLRPTREQAPELYHETKIGWIPKDWRVVTCQDVCEKIIDCKNRTPPITADGYPVIRTPNVRHGEFKDRALVFTDLHSYIIWTARGKPKVDDVVITREAPVGEVCKIPERHAHACLGQRMMLYRTDSSQINNDFFLYALQSEPIQLRLDLISGGSTVGHVRVGDIRDLWMYQPASEIEQTNIGNALNSISTILETEKIKLKKLMMQKTGLMHDLLSGKKSVSVDAQETTHV